MDIIVRKNYEELSREAFAIFRDRFEDSDVLGFATGRTPLGLYSIMSEECKAGKISFAGKKSFNLDEYYPIKPSDPRSYRQYMEANLFRNIDIKRKNVSFPDCTLGEEEAVRAYKRAYARNGPVGLQILGIGINGHIGFNEPGSGKDSAIRITNLSKGTISRNEPPVTRAMTMGIREILESRAILLVASGKDKSAAIKRAFDGEITEDVPVSFLQLHNDVTFVLDKDAASKVRH